MCYAFGVSVFFAYILKPFVLVGLFVAATVIAWPLRKFLEKKLKAGKLKDRLLTRI